MSDNQTFFHKYESTFTEIKRLLESKEYGFVKLIGSSSLKSLFEFTSNEMFKAGLVAKGLTLYSKADQILVSEHQIKFLEFVCKQDIVNSVCVCAILKNGVIGESTKQEIAFTEKLNIPVFTFNF